jgi:DNA repair exonuclease SbcCD ATPase subunit
MSKCEVCGCESPWHSDGCSGLIDELRAEIARLQDCIITLGQQIGQLETANAQLQEQRALDLIDHDNLNEQFDDLLDQIAKLRDELALWQASDSKELTPREKRLRAALEFYANPRNWRHTAVRRGPVPAVEDAGIRARKALKEAVDG